MEENESNPPPSQKPELIFRSYRRHRKQSRWGTYSLVAPPVALLWSMFWYLRMNRHTLLDQPRSVSTELVTLAAGCVVISLVGAALATAGVLDGYHKHGRATIGLTINCVLLVGVIAGFFLKAFSQGVG